MHPYETVTADLNLETKARSTFYPILLKNGKRLHSVIPFFISQDTTQSLFGPLKMFYLTSSGKVNTINVDEIEGVETKLEFYKDKNECGPATLEPFVYINYMHPKKGGITEQRRIRGKSIQIKFGINENHAPIGEGEDYYLSGEDMNYIDTETLVAKRIRHFPFWRLGIYGNPKDVSAHYQPPVETA